MRPDPAIRPQGLRLLVTSAGRRVGLIGCFRASAAALGIDLTVFACDRSPDWSSACQSADRSFAVPPVDDAGYLPALFALCHLHGIDMIIPTIDPELMPISRARQLFHSMGVDAVVSTPEVVALAGDKQATADLLASRAIAAPRTWPVRTGFVADDAAWPLLVKPRHGSAGRGIHTVATAHDLAAIPEDEPMIVQELLCGQEYTVNIFIDRDGRLRSAVPHRRAQVRAGEVEKGVTERNVGLADIARRIADSLPGARGPLCFQAMIDREGRASVFEINARFGGGYPLAHEAGAPFARWLLEERIGMPPSAGDAWREGVVMLRYDAALFTGP